MKQEALLMQESTEQMKQNVSNMLESQWSQARYDLKNARQRLDLFAKQNESTKIALDLLVTAYANSGADFTEILRTEQMLLQYRLMTEAAHKDYLVAYAQLEFLMAKNLIP
ncbi:MAG: TolC family protein [Saprospiraceae bacterium]|nr:TolC family protein [Saprospiraceae bacterium]